MEDIKYFKETEMIKQKCVYCGKEFTVPIRKYFGSCRECQEKIIQRKMPQVPYLF